ncbi:hypothetical protein BCR34DRAFT_609773 [Clohesyomyces aquaticus]|uniref:Uncharacterized protein n=1 Tax=Clohesyomyces aquaticus TaxID=1231657 RepID=A0A1Y2A9Z7_9PLEO|nr:hypothetical protein BCR34DRAFT_609773 [Clohesyomyces aquaticus]
MKAVILAILAPFAAAMAIPAALPAPEAIAQSGDTWLPDVFQCRCYNAATDTAKINPICAREYGHDYSSYPNGPIQCGAIAIQSTQHTNWLAPFFTDAACEKEFGAGFKGDCRYTGITVCHGTGYCNS